jgi:hypothetical protein
VPPDTTVNNCLSDDDCTIAPYRCCIVLIPGVLGRCGCYAAPVCLNPGTGGCRL